MSWRLLEGDGYSTFEWDLVKDTSRIDFAKLEEALLKLPQENTVTVAVPAGFRYSKELNRLGFSKVKEREVYSRGLEDFVPESLDPSLTFLEEPDNESIINCLTTILDCRQEAKNMIDLLFAEVARDKFRINLVKIRGRDAAVYIPHIEPHTEDEGRVFFFGIKPEFRGYGYGAKIHRSALCSLKKMLNARVYVGVTDSGNLKMKKVFERNGCTKTGSIAIYKR
ncbi:hypothetical protein ACQCVP_03480 [Rossellomorea vietnamensis]|uniref:hypothetical protein n=1 Tax=Rossellomorea vietnamensis TaxID=218284 RepID=UPI003CF64DE3